MKKKNKVGRPKKILLLNDMRYTFGKYFTSSVDLTPLSSTAIHFVDDYVNETIKNDVVNITKFINAETLKLKRNGYMSYEIEEYIKVNIESKNSEYLDVTTDVIVKTRHSKEELNVIYSHGIPFNSSYNTNYTNQLGTELIDYIKGKENSMFYEGSLINCIKRWFIDGWKTYTIPTLGYIMLLLILCKIYNMVRL